jgi:hypothetical protein
VSGVPAGLRRHCAHAFAFDFQSAAPRTANALGKTPHSQPAAARTMEGCEAKISTEVTTSATGVTVQEVGPNGNLMPKFNTPVEVSVSYDPEGVSINVSRGGASSTAGSKNVPMSPGQLIFNYSA